MLIYQTVTAVVLVGGEGDGILEILLRTGLFAKGILLVIFLLSVFAWAIMYHKYLVLQRIKRENADFLRVFRKSRTLDGALTSSREYSGSNLRKLADTGYRELKDYEENTQTGIPQSEIREGVLLTLERAVSREFVDLEKYLVFLAMVSTISPFLGLLGTVWGIMHAFMDIGTYGTANLSVVGPGIAEALITTIAGLGAAIPAVMGYNYFVSKVKAMGQEMENFASEFISMIIKRGVM